MSEGSTTPNLAELVREILEAAGREDWDSILAHYAPTPCGTRRDGHVRGTAGDPRVLGGLVEQHEHLQIDVLENRRARKLVVVGLVPFQRPSEGPMPSQSR